MKWISRESHNEFDSRCTGDVVWYPGNEFPLTQIAVNWNSISYISYVTSQLAVVSPKDACKVLAWPNVMDVSDKLQPTYSPAKVLFSCNIAAGTWQVISRRFPTIVYTGEAQERSRWGRIGSTKVQLTGRVQRGDQARKIDSRWCIVCITQIYLWFEKRADTPSAYRVLHASSSLHLGIRPSGIPHQSQDRWTSLWLGWHRLS